jgi:hypothetical protein
MSHLHRTAPRRSLRAAFVGLAALIALTGPAPRPAAAEGGDAVPPGQPAPDIGAKLFDDAINYVARGQGGIPQVTDFYVKLDARLDLDNQRHEGPMRLWFQAPLMYRQELTLNRATTTKILNQDTGWIVTPQGRVQALALTAEGRKSIEQLKEDRSRLYDITRFLTLQALKGQGVTFTFEGLKRGSGTYEGDWAKVVRKAGGRPNISFWLAYTRDAQGQITATYPGIVRVDGEPERGYPTEDYLLTDWDSAQSQPRSFRYPRRIEAYSLLTNSQGQSTPARFLSAIVEDIKINAGVDAARFQPPSAGAPGPGR